MCNWHEIEGWITAEECACLQLLCKGKGVLEIGSWKGRSALCMIDTAAFVDCVDHFKKGPDGYSMSTTESYDVFREFQLNTQDCDHLNLYLESFKEYAEFSSPGSYDVVFYDGGDSYLLMNQVLKWIDYHNYKGILAVHNYNVHDSITNAIDQFKGGVEYQVEGKVIWFNEDQLTTILLNQEGDASN